MKGYKSHLFLNVFFNALAIVFSVFSFSLLIPFLDLVFQKSAADYAAIVQQGVPTFYPNPKYFLELFNFKVSELILASEDGKSQVLLLICITTVVAILLKNISLYMAMFYAATVRNGVMRDVRATLYQKLLALDIDYFTKERKGDIMSRVSNDVQEIQWTVLTSIEMLFRDPIAIVLIFSFLFAISVKLTLFVLLVIPLTGLVIGGIASTLRKSAKRTQEHSASILSIFEETISGLKIIKGFGAQVFMARNFETINNRLMRANIQVFRQKDLASPLSEFLAVLVLVGVIWYGGNLILEENSLQSSEFIGFLVLFSQVIPPIKSLAGAQMNISRAAAAADRIDLFLETPHAIKEVEHPRVLDAFTHSIELKNVHFSYSNDIPVLQGIDLLIPKGKTVALVGASGGGKSTLMDLVARFYDPTQGTVLIDGIDIKQYTQASIAGHIGMVTQDTFLFHDTVANNIGFNDPLLSPEKIKEAAKIAHAHGFIEQLENGYETIIGDRGTKLSGGQRQRLSIARAVLKNPEILILDEATSALDTQSEQEVQQAIAQIMKGRTALVIAHRLSTIQNADLIVVLERGKIIEQGTHSALMGQQGVYKRLCDIQSFA